MESSSSSTTLNYFSSFQSSPNLDHLQTPSPKSSRQAHFPRRSSPMICRSAAVQTFPETRTSPAVTTTTTLYDVLRVSHSASSREIKAAYRSLAKMYHPDTMMMMATDSDSTAGDDFIEIRNAYETLSDPSARAMYDLSMRVGAAARRSYTYSSASSGYSATRRWETDQCW